VIIEIVKKHYPDLEIAKDQFSRPTDVAFEINKNSKQESVEIFENLRNNLPSEYIVRLSDIHIYIFKEVTVKCQL